MSVNESPCALFKRLRDQWPPPWSNWQFAARCSTTSAPPAPARSSAVSFSANRLFVSSSVVRQVFPPCHPVACSDIASSPSASCSRCPLVVSNSVLFIQLNTPEPIRQTAEIINSTFHMAVVRRLGGFKKWFTDKPLPKRGNQHTEGPFKKEGSISQTSDSALGNSTQFFEVFAIISRAEPNPCERGKCQALWSLSIPVLPSPTKGVECRRQRLRNGGLRNPPGPEGSNGSLFSIAAVL